MYFSPVHNVVYFRARMTETPRQEDEKRNVSGKDVAVATGATGATGSAMAQKGTLSSFSSLNKKINTTTRTTKETLQLASQTGSQAKSVFGKFAQNCARYKQGIINFGQRVTTSPILKPILQSRVYRGFAGFLGGATAGLVAIFGIGEVTTTFARKADELTNH